MTEQLAYEEDLDPGYSDHGLSSTVVERVNPKDYVAPGTGLHRFLAWFVLVFVVLVSVLATYGIALIFWLIALATRASRDRIEDAKIRGSAIQIDDDQFPKIQQRAAGIAEKLGMRSCPDIYMIESNEQNAAALKIGKRSLIVLIDDIVYGALATKNAKVLDFFIAHELAHHALGHTNTVRRQLSSAYKPLSRLDEFSCDAVAAAVVAEDKASFDAMTLLLVGPQLFKSVNVRSVVDQAADVAANKYSRRAERSLTHPLPLRRLARLIDPSVKP